MKKLLLLVPFFASLNAFAAGVWSPLAVPTSVEDYGAGSTVYGMDLSANPANCTNATNRIIVRPDIDDIGKNRMNSIILAAIMGNRPIRVKISDTTCSASGTYPTYYAVRISD